LIHDTGMFIKCRPNSTKTKWYLSICHSVREGSTVSQKVIRYLGAAHSEEQKKALIQLGKAEIRQLKELTKQKTKREDKCGGVLLSDVTEIGRVTEGFHDIFGTMFDKIGLGGLFTCIQYERLKNVVISRIADSKSKRQTAKLLTEEYKKPISVNQIYRLMDVLNPLHTQIQQHVFETSKCFMPNGQVNILLYDVTTLHFESQVSDLLREKGMSKDHKIGEVQVVLALATDPNGLPIGYHLFPGNTAEVSTLLVSLEEWINVLKIQQVSVVADRAMMSETNLNSMDQAKFKYTVAAKLKSLPQTLQNIILSEKANIDLSSRSWVLELKYRGRRLIVSYSESRAKKDRKDREKLLINAKKKFGDRVGSKKLITNKGYLKYFKEKSKGEMVFDASMVEEEAKWDGLHGIITNENEESSKNLLDRYKKLWVIEESFKINKNTLRMRPMFHFTPRRIEAHVMICYLAYALGRYVQRQIAQFDKEMSIQHIKDELKRVSSSLLESDEGELFKMPCHMTEEATKIYRSFGINRKRHPEKVVLKEKCSVSKKMYTFNIKGL
jgi:transposase